MSRELPLWRSLLFVPANVERFVARAPLCDADAIIIDLEDGVPAAQKTDARQAIPDAVLQLRRSGTEVVVRINPEPDLARSLTKTDISSPTITLSETPMKLKFVYGISRNTSHKLWAVIKTLISRC